MTENYKSADKGENSRDSVMRDQMLISPEEDHSETGNQ